MRVKCSQPRLMYYGLCVYTSRSVCMCTSIGSISSFNIPKDFTVEFRDSVDNLFYPHARSGSSPFLLLGGDQPIYDDPSVLCRAYSAHQKYSRVMYSISFTCTSKVQQLC